MSVYVCGVFICAWLIRRSNVYRRVSDTLAFLYDSRAFDRRNLKRTGNGTHWAYVFLMSTLRVGTSLDLASYSIAEAAGSLDVHWPPHFVQLMGSEALPMLHTKRGSHAALRSRLGELFSSTRMRLGCAGVDGYICEALVRWQREGPFVLNRKCRELALRTIFGIVFGENRCLADIPRVSEDLFDLMSGLESWVPIELPVFGAFGRGMRARRRLEVFIRSQMKQCVPEDTHVLAQLQYQSSKSVWTEQQVVDNTLVLFFAGSDTTAVSLCSAACVLFDPAHAAVLQTLRLELDVFADRMSHDDKNLYDELIMLPYLRAVMDELWRLYTPVNSSIRRTNREITLGADTLPAGTIISTYVTEPNERVEVWGENVDRFLPERMFAIDEVKVRSTLRVFGNAPRTCIGERLARMETALFIYRLVTQYELIDVAPRRVTFPFEHIDSTPVRIVPRVVVQ